MDAHINEMKDNVGKCEIEHYIIPTGSHTRRGKGTLMATYMEKVEDRMT
jgi:hypothetical protein